jgi:hypothetical protein
MASHRHRVLSLVAHFGPNFASQAYTSGVRMEFFYPVDHGDRSPWHIRRHECCGALYDLPPTGRPEGLILRHEAHCAWKVALVKCLGTQGLMRRKQALTESLEP